MATGEHGLFIWVVNENPPINPDELRAPGRNTRIGPTV